MKKSTRYRYYVTGAAKDHSQEQRIAAGNLEIPVIGRLRDLLAEGVAWEPRYPREQLIEPSFPHLNCIWNNLVR